MIHQPLKIQIKSPLDLPVAAKQLVSFAHQQRIVLLNGEMGAGKTTLVKQLCKTLGSNDDVSSPTFSIINEYSSTSGNIFHFDFYRIKHQEEALDIGFEEYLDFGSWCFIEWAEKVNRFLPENYLEVNIEVTGQSSRQIIARHI